ncbi:pantoate--beta-alanine ligase [Mesorhizobium sp. f-mel]
MPARAQRLPWCRPPHVSLLRAAIERADRVIVTLFVNPKQFTSQAISPGYPRTEDEDAPSRRRSERTCFMRRMLRGVPGRIRHAFNQVGKGLARAHRCRYSPRHGELQ